MDFTATVEASNGDMLSVLDANNQLCGDFLASLFLSLRNYCSVPDEFNQWLSQLDNNLEISLCDLVEPLINSFYSGNWDYNPNEYDVYVRQEGNIPIPITEKQFKDTIEKINSLWKDVEIINSVVTNLIVAFQQLDSNAKNIPYEPEKYLEELISLSKILNIFLSRGIKKIRLKFTV